MTAPASRFNVAAETAKLSFKESDWNLPGGHATIMRTRTRHGGSGRPDLSTNKRITFVELESSEEEVVSSSESEDEEVDEEEEEDEDEDIKKEKPVSTRIIVERDQLMEAFEKNCVCKDCHGPVEVSIRTLCLATTYVISCKDSKCGYIYYSQAAAPASDIPRRTRFLDNRDRMTDYAVNVLYVVGLMACGDGGKEAGRLLGLLGLPNDTTMEGRSFGIIEERISPAIRKLTKDILHENLEDEVRRTLEASQDGAVDDSDFKMWKQAQENKEIAFHPRNYPKVSGSFDMAWQQRNSGNRYASPSGHALIVGRYNRKPIALCLKSKLCNKCSNWHKRKIIAPVPYHECTKNHDGTSGSMEPLSCLDMAIGLYEDKQVILSQICIDDDASTRALLKWSNADYMKNTNTTVVPMVAKTKGKNAGDMKKRDDRGKLPGMIPEPFFLADPNHRRKVFTGDLHKLLAAPVKERAGLTRMDVTRLGKNFGYMIKGLQRLDESAFEEAGKAVLEHHFDCHQHCGAWCPRKRLTATQRAASLRFYRCKVKDVLLYKVLQEKLSRFTTLDRLKEVAHGMDTQVNEGFNNTVSWFAPKNKVYCGSPSLANRVGIAIGINMLGLHEYFKRLFKSLGIVMTDNVTYFLQAKQKHRFNRLTKNKTSGAKKLRNKRKHDQLANDTALATVARRKKEGTYESGQNMKDDGDDEQQEQDDAANQRRQRTAAVRNKVCPLCGKKGHSTARSSSCTHYKGSKATVAPVQEDAFAAALHDDVILRANAAADMDSYDAMPLDGGDDDDIFGSDGEDDGEGIVRAPI
jgi:hypothetical protein